MKSHLSAWPLVLLLAILFLVGSPALAQFVSPPDVSGRGVCRLYCTPAPSGGSDWSSGQSSSGPEISERERRRAQAQALNEDGRQAFINDDFASALNYFIQARDTFPEFAPYSRNVLLAEAMILWDQAYEASTKQDWVTTTKLMRKAFEKLPEWRPLREDLSRAVDGMGVDAAKRGEWARAIEYFIEALGIDPNNAHARENLRIVRENQWRTEVRSDSAKVGAEIAARIEGLLADLSRDSSAGLDFDSRSSSPSSPSAELSFMPAGGCGDTSTPVDSSVVDLRCAGTMVVDPAKVKGQSPGQSQPPATDLLPPDLRDAAAEPVDEEKRMGDVLAVMMGGSQPARELELWESLLIAGTRKPPNVDDSSLGPDRDASELLQYLQNHNNVYRENPQFADEVAQAMWRIAREQTYAEYNATLQAIAAMRYEREHLERQGLLRPGSDAIAQAHSNALVRHLLQEASQRIQQRWEENDAVARRRAYEQRKLEIERIAAKYWPRAQ